MITEAMQAIELSQLQCMEKQKNVKICLHHTYMHIYIYMRIFNNRQQKNVLLLVHISQRQTKYYIGTLLMSEYFGKCFGPFTQASKFLAQMPQLFITKFASQLKLIQSVVPVGILGICVTSSILSVLLSEFWVSGSEFPSPRDPFPGFWVSESQFHGPGCQGVVSQNLGSHGLRVGVSRSQGPGSQGPGVSGLRVPDLGSQVLILDYANISQIFHFCF